MLHSTLMFNTFGRQAARLFHSKSLLSSSSLSELLGAADVGLGCTTSGRFVLAPNAAAAMVHTTSSTQIPQYGGYLSTGHAAGATSPHRTTRYLVTGACGQIGTELVSYIRARVGQENVIASDVKTTRQLLEGGPFVYCDVQDKDNLTRIILENGISYVVHLATLLSAVGERNPQLALRINTTGIQHVLDLAAAHGLQVYSPSTIAVFGSTSPMVMTPDDTIMQPGTMYGITKVHQELLGNYYKQKFGVDFRSLRYPGIISASAPPGGGTTDYAVEIFHSALKTGKYNSFLSEDALLPMMYMPDCLEATWQLMNAPIEQLTRCTYNVTAMSFSPAQLAEAIKLELPHFQISYTPDFRNDIANTWPDSIDDTNARRDWGWQHKYDVNLMTRHMLTELDAQFKAQKPTVAPTPGAAVGSARATRMTNGQDPLVGGGGLLPAPGIVMPLAQAVA